MTSFRLSARDALLIEAYRLGKLRIGLLARALGMGVAEADQWLAQRGVSLNYSFQDFKADETRSRKFGVDRRDDSRSRHGPAK